MGTNYYLQHGVCECCKKPESTRHIGKSSSGWCFALHIYPEDGINDLDDWKKLLAEKDSRIINEYNEVISLDDMLDEITDRSWNPRENKPYGYDSWEVFHSKNYSEDGPNNLLRHRIMQSARTNDRQSFTNGCIGHGEGTWDYMVGEFS